MIAACSLLALSIGDCLCHGITCAHSKAFLADVFELRDSQKAITYTVGVWGRMAKAWIVAPMSCKVEYGASAFTDTVYLMVAAGDVRCRLSPQ